MSAPPARRPAQGRGPARFVVRYLLILSTVPYLALKAAWLGGSTVGILDPAFADDPSLSALNAVTVAMDLVVVGLAFALTSEWGLRLPAWLITLPMWVGTGLLAAIAVVTPVDLIAELADSTDVAAGEDVAGRGLPLSPWVPSVVYAGFTVQAILLVVGFGLYAAARWPAVFGTRVGDGGPGATHAAQVLLARTFGAVAAGLGLVRAYWAVAERGDLSTHLTQLVFALLSFAAAVGVVMLVDRVGVRRPLWLPVVLVWFGAGSLFAWGLWQTANRALGTALAGASAQPLPAAVDLAGTVAGLLIAVAATFHLVEQRLSAGQQQNQAFTQA